jgi:hypothetical protein
MKVVKVAAKVVVKVTRNAPEKGHPNYKRIS